MKKVKNVLILAGGDSTRFWPLTNKSYYTFLGKPLLLHQLDNSKKFGENIFIVVNPSDLHLVNQLKVSHKFTIVPQKKDLNGQSGAILSSENIIKDETLILNAEDLYDSSIVYQCINTSIQYDVDYLFVVKRTKGYFPGGYIKFEGKKPVQIIEKPKPENTPSDLVKLVIDYVKDFQEFIKILSNIKTSNDDQYEQGLNALLKTKSRISYQIYDGYWYALKYPWHVLPMMQHFLKINLNNEVRLGKNVRVSPNSKIVGPSFIDDNSIVGDFAMIRESHIGKNCIIGGYSEVTRSYLRNNVSLHRNYVGDSVLDSNVSMGAGAVTANFRFDGKSVNSIVGKKKIDTGLTKFGSIIGESSKIGVNATLLPGIKIGKNTFIGPGETVYEDIKDNIFLLNRKQSKNKENG